MAEKLILTKQPTHRDIYDMPRNRTDNGLEAFKGEHYYRVMEHGVMMYQFDELTERIVPAGQLTRDCYDFIQNDEEQEYTFPDGEKTIGVPCVYRWSTNSFKCIIKKKDLVDYN